MGKDTSMKEPLNGIEYLNMLEKENGGQAATHADLAHYLDEKARKAGVPLGGQFELTPLCNFSCRMCYVHLEKEQLGKASLLTTEQWKDLLFQAWKPDGSDALRQAVGRDLGIGSCNAKAFCRRLSASGISREELLAAWRRISRDNR